ncbi:MAG: hypothetical protein HYT72_05415 [Candidatus Aenigmarchaeota archaeon]|nr:hypothetical protein [Candidatus Aenigmarchaeota archaeon]
MKLNKPIRRSDIVFLVAAVFMIGFIVGSHLSYNAPVEKEVVKYIIANFTEVNGTSVEMLVPAVDQSGRGVVARLVTTIKPGSGLVLVNVNDVFAQQVMQFSGRVAAAAAVGFSKIELKNVDIIYSVIVNASSIEGPSAGAAMALSIIAGLENKTLDKDVMITGTISENGTIGQAGGIFEKAAAAKAAGIKTFLVPEGQSLENNVFRERSCRAFDSVEYCAVNYIQKNSNFGEILNMTVVEVGSVEEALRYFESK